MFIKIILFLCALFVTIGILPIFLPSHFSMSRSIEIQASITNVFVRLADLNEYNKWNPFPEGDSTNQTHVFGQGVGSSLTWKGQKTGEGKMSIVNIEPNKKVDIKMEFFKPMEGEGMVHWVLSEQSMDKTVMTWSFEQDLTYFKRYFGLIMESMMGKHFEKGLQNFKQLVEGK